MRAVDEVAIRLRLRGHQVAALVAVGVQVDRVDAVFAQERERHLGIGARFEHRVTVALPGPHRARRSRCRRHCGCEQRGQQPLRHRHAGFIPSAVPAPLSPIWHRQCSPRATRDRHQRE
jgi:hypothetical protein